VALNLDFVLEQIPSDPSFDVVRGALAECRHASDRIFRVIANLLDVTRCEEGRLVLRLASVSLPPLFARVVVSHEAELAQRQVELRVLTADDVTAIDADVDLFSRVLHNLIDNALRNTRAGGNIVLSAHMSSRESVEIRIKNDGPAIPLPVRERLFVRSVGTEGESSGINRGLGLYFCRIAIEELGATIALSEEPEFPVCFVIRYPVPIKSVRAL